MSRAATDADDLKPPEMPAEVETLFAVSAASAIRGALGTVYFSFTSWCEAPLLVVDWDVQPIATSLTTYVPTVLARLQAIRESCRVVVYPDDIALYAEPEGLGNVVLLEAHKGGYEVREVREDIRELVLADRATPALVYVHTGKVKFSRAAYEKNLNFRSTARNHLRTQIDAYKVDQRADEAELLTAWCTGILLALAP